MLVTSQSVSHVAAIVRAAATCCECLRALEPSFGALESKAPPRFRTSNGKAACNFARASGRCCQIIALLRAALLLLLHVLLLLLLLLLPRRGW